MGRWLYSSLPLWATRAAPCSCATRTNDAFSLVKTPTAPTAPHQSHSKQGRRSGGLSSRSVRVRCAAFYGDCKHELKTVTRGVRLCLLYNLVRTTPALSPVAATGQAGSAAQRRLSAAVQSWANGPRGWDKILVPLEHEYTKTNLSFGGLKGRDLGNGGGLAGLPEARPVPGDRGQVPPVDHRGCPRAKVNLCLLCRFMLLSCGRYRVRSELHCWFLSTSGCVADIFRRVMRLQAIRASAGGGAP